MVLNYDNESFFLVKSFEFYSSLPFLLNSKKHEIETKVLNILKNNPHLYILMFKKINKAL